MSHEFRTPLNAVIGLSDLLSRMQLPGKVPEYLRHIQQAGKQLLRLTDDLLDLACIEGGDMRLQDIRFELAALLDVVRTLVQPEADAKGLALLLQSDPGLPSYVVGDPLRLRQVLVNLAGNAVKFTPAGTVTVCAKVLHRTQAQVKLRFDVADTGVGIAPEARRLIFEAFTQADSSLTRHFGGSGLGLPIVRRLVTLMDGQVEFDSIPGQGSTFRVTLTLGVPGGA
ncbi:sensor histidine kinase [Azohydromonas lata]|uniref:histidine kinase n=1 Tax=Azohydromonas lata TaxID=45677 RepID=A0ABU5I7T3_9BURK|nr:ATP-binding protein [Azohydromonas lata]MDZ5454957.1 ATP-binding protein [Azohydromonas lata]